jgi:hypothetical protein
MGRWKYINDLEENRVKQFIKQSLEKNPNIEYTTGPRMSRDPSKVGIYYRINDGMEFDDLVYLAPNL